MNKEINNSLEIENKKLARSWQELENFIPLSGVQRKQFETYLQLLSQENKKVNLTAITDPANMVRYHFQDSLAIVAYIKNNDITGICDVGSGGGFPGIPLAIMFPDINVHLIEVIGKKINFLHKVIDALGLENVVVHQKDWRTFLRSISVDANLFVARASLHTDELFRMFKPSCLYKDETLVYWASDKWEATEKEQAYIQDSFVYKVGYKKRVLYFFKHRAV